LGPLEIEPQKRARYSKALEPDEIEEVLMDEESDEELEETDELIESVCSPHPLLRMRTAHRLR
jgi:hypothetical protein